jgi:site-specific DNA-methyltransferase (adenine-specific)
MPPVSKLTFNEFMSDGDPSQYLDREDVWTIDREYKSPTMIKNQTELPTKLVEKIIQYSSNTGDKVMDMFLGGFTTALIALQLGREPLGFEINERAYEHFKPRFQKQRD